METKTIQVPLRDGVMGAYLALPEHTPAGAIIAMASDMRLAAPDTRERDLQSEHFNIDVDKAIETLEQKIRTMEDELEPSVRNAPAGSRYQFERLGYFCVDRDSQPGHVVFNRTATLKDTWAKVRE